MIGRRKETEQLPPPPTKGLNIPDFSLCRPDSQHLVQQTPELTLYFISCTFLSLSDSMNYFKGRCFLQNRDPSDM